MRNCRTPRVERRFAPTGARNTRFSAPDSVFDEADNLVKSITGFKAFGITSGRAIDPPARSRDSRSSSEKGTQRLALKPGEDDLQEPRCRRDRVRRTRVEHG